MRSFSALPPLRCGIIIASCKMRFSRCCVGGFAFQACLRRTRTERIGTRCVERSHHRRASDRHVQERLSKRSKTTALNMYARPARHSVVAIYEMMLHGAVECGQFLRVAWARCMDDGVCRTRTKRILPSDLSHAQLACMDAICRSTG